MNKSRIMELVLVLSFIAGLLSVSVLAKVGGSTDLIKGEQAYNNYNYVTAAELYKKACDNPDPASNGCNNLGVLFFKGKGVRRNLVKAYHYFYLAKEFGSPYSQGTLDRLCSKIPSVCIPSNRY